MSEWTFSQDQMPRDAAEDDIFLVAFDDGEPSDYFYSYRFMKPCIESGVDYWMPYDGEGNMWYIDRTWWAPMTATVDVEFPIQPPKCPAPSSPAFGRAAA